MEKSYWVRFHAEEAGQNYSVEMPDLPGCLTCGDSWDEAQYMAKDAVRGWLEITLLEGDPLPRARSRAEVEALPVDSEMGLAELVLITVTPFEKVQYDFPDGLLADMARASLKEGLTVNELLMRAAREYLARR